MASSYEIYSDSDDDSDNGYNVDDAFINLSIQAEAQDRGNNGQWRYLAYSDRGASIYGNNRTTILPSNQFKLAFNAADEIQCSKFKIEIRHSYNASKRKLRLREDRAFTPAEALAAATPRKFIESFDEYLGSGLKEDETKPWGFDDIVEFIRTDIFMRHHTCSAAELQMYRMPGKHKFDIDFTCIATNIPSFKTCSFR